MCTAVMAAGMPAKVSGKHATRRRHKPFLDAECLALKRQVYRAADIRRKALEAQYYALLRDTKRAYKLSRLKP